MEKCPNCLHINKHGVLVCDKCGVALFGAAAVIAKSNGNDKANKPLIQKLLAFLAKSETKHFEDVEATQQMVIPVAESADVVQAFTNDPMLFPLGTSLLLRVDNYEIVIESPNRDIILGRFNPTKPPPTDMHVVNLTDFQGYKYGVSRLHATIRRTQFDQLELIDLGSSNGSFLNSYKLTPQQPYHIYDGDMVQIGHLPMQVYFLYP
jgi:hypothetical protein